MAASNPGQKVGVQLDADTAFQVDQMLRRGLASSGAVTKDAAISIPSTAPREGLIARILRALGIGRGRASTVDISLELDAKTAAAVSQLLRDGLVTAGAAHEANNRSVAAAIGNVLGQQQTPGA
jgi:hypothetical protein